MKVIWIVVVAVLSVMLLGCAERKPIETPMKTPKITLTITPPPPAITNVPPALEIGLFIDRYNHRDLDGILQIFSERIKTEYVVEDFEKELEFAEAHGIRIVGWDIVNVTVHPLGRERGKVVVNLTIEWDGNVSSKILDVPMVCGRHACEIDGWIFSSLRQNG
jgi:hypothetical protein